MTVRTGADLEALRAEAGRPQAGRYGTRTRQSSALVAFAPPILYQRLAFGAARCCSSVVEHSLGKGEVDSSILSSSTIF
jgi:hypothetical protein